MNQPPEKVVIAFEAYVRAISIGLYEEGIRTRREAFFNALNNAAEYDPPPSPPNPPGAYCSCPTCNHNCRRQPATRNPK